MAVTHTPGPDRKRLEAAIKAIADRVGKVGWFATDKKKIAYTDGTPVAYVAAIQEFGYPPKNIPPRMGLRQMFPGKRAEWAQIAKYGAQQILKGNATGISIMELLGGAAEGDIRKQIKSVVAPPLKDATLEHRAHRMGISVGELTETGKKPLNDTGLLIATLTHAVVPKGEAND